MSLRQIVLVPDRRLRAVADPVTEMTDEVRQQIDDMFETMYDAPGIGLAAPQIGVLNRVIVVDCGKRTHREEAEETENSDDAIAQEEDIDEEELRDPIALINPEILWTSQETNIRDEGCLSIPEAEVEVERPKSIKLRYWDREMNEIEREADGLLATCIQHEVDHLDGKLIIDHLSRLKRDRIVKKVQKNAKRDGKASG